MKMEAARHSEKSVIVYQSVRRRIEVRTSILYQPYCVSEWVTLGRWKSVLIYSSNIIETNQYEIVLVDNNGSESILIDNERHDNML